MAGQGVFTKLRRAGEEDVAERPDRPSRRVAAEYRPPEARGPLTERSSVRVVRGRTPRRADDPPDRDETPVLRTAAVRRPSLDEPTDGAERATGATLEAEVT